MRCRASSAVAVRSRDRGEVHWARAPCGRARAAGRPRDPGIRARHFRCTSQRVSTMPPKRTLDSPRIGARYAASADCCARAVQGARLAVSRRASSAALRQATKWSPPGLLERAYGYYAWRSGVSFVLLGVGFVVALFAADGRSGRPGPCVLLAFGSVQVALDRPRRRAPGRLQERARELDPGLAVLEPGPGGWLLVLVRPPQPPPRQHQRCRGGPRPAVGRTGRLFRDDPRARPQPRCAG